MKSFAALAMVGAVMALPQPQAVTSAIAPSESTPSGCSTSFSGQFEISVVNVTSASKRSLEARQSKALTLTLKDGILTDDLNRIGYIASNQQFQFDGPVQAGAIYTAGWSVCSNNTLALGDSAIFYQCLSGTFYNLYDESTGAQCNAIYLDVIAVDSSAASTATVASQIADGQVTGTPVSQISDGQIQATTGVVVSQISDGQIQASTAPATTSKAVVSQISDGQIQATTGASKAVVSQISDGQIQATTGAASSKAVVSQISDGQIQATAGTTSKAVVSQISDGQIQATTGVASSSKAVVTQISDGQIQATANGTIATATPSISTFTGAAATAKAGFFGLAAGAVAIAML